jgi:hypothetical protein
VYSAAANGGTEQGQRTEDGWQLIPSTPRSSEHVKQSLHQTFRGIFLKLLVTVKTAIYNEGMSSLQVNVSVDGLSLDFYACFSEIKKSHDSKIKHPKTYVRNRLFVLCVCVRA